jgi:hypothetical protein
MSWDSFLYLIYFLVAARVVSMLWKDYMERDCPFCKKKVPKAASVCSFCGRDIPIIETIWSGGTK